MRKCSLPANVCNPVGASAYLAIAIYELPEAAPELVQCAEEMCQFLRTRCQADGTIAFAEAGVKTNDGEEFVCPGAALTAIAMSNRVKPMEWKKAALAKAMPIYREQFRKSPNPAFITWMTPAMAELHLQTRDASAAEFVFEMCDWMVKLQFENPERQRASWRGGFPSVADGKIVPTGPTIDSAFCAMALGDVCRMIRTMEKPDAARFDRYRVSLTRALQFLTTLQYGEENTGHIAAHFRGAMIGAFHPSSIDGNLRADHTAIAVAAYSQYLLAGADR